MEAGQEVWSEDEVVVDVGRGYAVVSGLDPQRRYVVRMQVGNGQGTYVHFVCVFMYDSKFTRPLKI